MLGWAHRGFHKKRARTHYSELVFLHTVGSAGHIVLSGAAGPRNIVTLSFFSDGTGTVSTKSTPGHVTVNLCFCIRWDLRVT
jgi:hypothetical protein